MRILINCLNSETFISYFILRDPLLVILVCGIWFMILSQIYCRPNQSHVRHSIILVVFNMIFCPGLVSERLFFCISVGFRKSDLLIVKWKAFLYLSVWRCLLLISLVPNVFFLPQSV